MKYILTIILLMAPVFNEIAEINKHKKQAREAYVNGDYETALTHYTYLVDSLGVNEPEVLLNLGNTLYKLQDTTAAISAYGRVDNSGEAMVQSVAKQQNGILFNKSKKPEEALQYFKQALKDDPTNEDARYNYEMLKKALEKQKEEEEQEQENQEENQEQQEQQENQEQENQNQENQDQENQQQEQESDQSDQKKEDEQGEESDETDEDAEDSEQQEQSDKQKEQQEGEDAEQQDQENQNPEDQDLNNINEKLKDMKISEEKARMILEAMKNNEIQYFQQNKRKPTKKVDTSKPDW